MKHEGLSELDRRTARAIIETVGAHGTPPEWGFQFFSVGIEPWLRVIERDYLEDYIAEGGSAFKLVVGEYGGGKTHFLYSVRELAWKHRFAASYVSLSAESSPFHKLDRVYAAITEGLMPPMGRDELLSGAERGLDAFIKRVFAEWSRRLRDDGVAQPDLREALAEEAASSTAGVGLPAMRVAIEHAFRALEAHDDETYRAMLAWLSAEPTRRGIYADLGLGPPIDRARAFAAIRALGAWMRGLGYRGLVVLFDEAEQPASLSSKQREMVTSNLREIIDACGHSTLQGMMFFYAVPSLHMFEGASNVYEALNQRVATVFDILNPTGVRIDLERAAANSAVSMLQTIGGRLAAIYEIAYGAELDAKRTDEAIDAIARAAWDAHFGDIGFKRVFVRSLVSAMHRLRLDPAARIDDEAARALVGGAGAGGM